jgi:hypothetical protein
MIKKKRVMIAQQMDQIKKESVNCNMGKKYIIVKEKKRCSSIISPLNMEGQN